MDKFNEQYNLYNNGEGLCICKYLIINGICSNPNCPTKTAFDNGYRNTKLEEQYPVVEIQTEE